MRPLNLSGCLRVGVRHPTRPFLLISVDKTQIFTAAVKSPIAVSASCCTFAAVAAAHVTLLPRENHLWNANASPAVDEVLL